MWTFDTALPTITATASVLINQGGSGSVYDFAINDAGTVAYLTNDSTIQRWTFDGSSWSLANTSSTIVTGLTGLAVEFGPTVDKIYTVTPSNLYSLTFSGGSFSSASTLATAGTNYAFRGLEFSPIPEPGTATLIAIGLGASAIIRRRRKA